MPHYIIRLYVRLSATFRYRDRIGWNTLKIISWLVSLAQTDPSMGDLVQREHPKN